MLQNYVNNELPLRRPIEVITVITPVIFYFLFFFFKHKAHFEGLKGLH